VVRRLGGGGPTTGRGWSEVPSPTSEVGWSTAEEAYRVQPPLEKGRPISAERSSEVGVATLDHEMRVV